VTTGKPAQDERLQKGFKTGIVGIVLNGLLAAGKLSVGLLYGNNAILTDGVNNLTDAGTSAAAAAGFAFSRKKPAGRRLPIIPGWNTSADYSCLSYCVCRRFRS